MDIFEAREKISEIDREMAVLFQERMRTAEEIARYKKEKGLDVLDRDVEERKLEEGSRLIEDERLRPFYKEFLQALMDISKEWQCFAD